MIDIVITRESPAETGGGVWRAGGTYSASDSYAAALIGRGDAYDPAGDVVDIGNTGLVGDGLAPGSYGDIVAVGNPTTGLNISSSVLTAAARSVTDDATVADMVNTLGGSTSTGSGGLVRATSPTLVSPILGTPTSINLSNGTSLPVSTGISGLGTGVAGFLGTPSSANLRTAVTDETGSGALVFASSPTLVAPILGTPASGTLTNCTGLPAAGVAGLTTVATDVIFDAAGDLVLGTGANTAARLVIGATGNVLRSNGTTAAWAALAAADISIADAGGKFTAIEVEGALQELADRIASTGGGGGSDRTAATTETVDGVERIATETIDGLPKAYSYDVSQRLTVDEWLAGGLERTVEYSTVPGFGIATGNRIVNGGQIYVPSADMPALKVGLVGLGAVVVPAQFWVPEYHCAFCWDEVDQRFRPASGGEISLGVTLSKPTATIPNGSYSSNAYSLTLPGWLRGKSGALRIWTHWGFDTTNSITKDVKTIVNGTDLQISTTSPGTVHSYQHDSVIFFESETAAFHLPAGTGGTNSPSGASSNGGAAFTKPTYTADAALTITAKVLGNGAPGATATATVERVELFYR
jgi:hypothetical protein